MRGDTNYIPKTETSDGVSITKPVIEDLKDHIKEYPMTEDEAFGKPYMTKFKEVDDDTFALHIDTLGCIVLVGESLCFVPDAALTENADGTFDLIRGRKFNG